MNIRSLDDRQQFVPYKGKTPLPAKISLNKSDDWLSKYIYNYEPLPPQLCCNILVSFTINSGKADFNICALKSYGAAGDRSHQSPKALPGKYINDFTVKGVDTKTLPIMEADLNVNITAGAKSGVPLDVKYSNPYYPDGKVSPYWLSNVNPNSDPSGYAKGGAVSSDMVKLTYADDSKLGYYGSAVLPAQKNNIWNIDIFHLNTVEYQNWMPWKQNTYIPNDPNPAAFDLKNPPDPQYQFNLGNYGVTDRYNITATNADAKPRVLNYILANEYASNIVAVRDESGNLLNPYTLSRTNPYAICKKISGTKVDDCMFSVTVPPGKTVKYTVDVTLPDNCLGGMVNSLEADDKSMMGPEPGVAFPVYSAMPPKNMFYDGQEYMKWENGSLYALSDGVIATLPPAIGATPAPSFTPTPSVSPTPKASLSPTPKASLSPTPSASVTPTPSASVLPAPSASVSPSPTPTASASARPTVSPTPTPTLTPVPSPTTQPWQYFLPPGVSLKPTATWQPVTLPDSAKAVFGYSGGNYSILRIPNGYAARFSAWDGFEVQFDRSPQNKLYIFDPKFNLINTVTFNGYLKDFIYANGALWVNTGSVFSSVDMAKFAPADSAATFPVGGSGDSITEGGGAIFVNGGTKLAFQGDTPHDVQSDGKIFWYMMSRKNYLDDLKTPNILAVSADGLYWTSYTLPDRALAIKNVNLIGNNVTAYGRYEQFSFPAGFPGRGVSVILNKELLVFDVPAQIINSRTMVPLRFIFEKLGAAIDWNDAARTVDVTRGTTKMHFQIDKNTATVNGQTKTLDTPPQIIDGRTLIPVRFLAESLGYSVVWDDKTQTAWIDN